MGEEVRKARGTDGGGGERGEREAAGGFGAKGGAGKVHLPNVQGKGGV